MTQLRLDLFDRRFDDLVEAGRARIPNLAPDWTDHNLHDPGIMLMELLAWTAEAQIYALSRMRQDERRAYGALLGIAPHGPLPAAGLIWPDAGNAAAELPAWDPGTVIGKDAAVRSAKPEAPVFWPIDNILLTPARIEAVRTRHADGGSEDHTSANRRGGAGFEPFGAAGDPADVLELALRCDGERHLLSGLAFVPAGARLALGVRVGVHTGDRIQAPRKTADAVLRVTLVSEQGRVALPLAADTTAGFMQSGVLLLDLSALAQSPPLRQCRIDIAAPAGFARAPRIQCIEPNVLPVEQSMTVQQEMHPAGSGPDQVVAFDQAGLRFGPGAPPIQVELAADGSLQAWEARPDFDSSGPADRHYRLDTGAAQVAFGNGVNGALPAADAQVLLSYAASDGAAGNVPRNQHWSVRGVSGVFGVNLDAMAGGADALGFDELRREARRRVRTEHALVTRQDVIDAALALADLQVARAEVFIENRAPGHGTVLPGTLTLAALRARTPGDGSQQAESPRWLEAVRTRLAERLPLGERLRVIAPRYVRVRIAARLVAMPMEDPARIASDARALLRARLALTADRPGASVWPFATPLSAIHVAAWLRKLPGVERVAECRLYQDDASAPVQKIILPRIGLPALDSAASEIEVQRRGTGKKS